jgi:hypothetical protein
MITLKTIEPIFPYECHIKYEDVIKVKSYFKLQPTKHFILIGKDLYLFNDITYKYSKSSHTDFLGLNYFSYRIDEKIYNPDTYNNLYYRFSSKDDAFFIKLLFSEKLRL